MSCDQPQRVNGLSGRVDKGSYAKGSKSQRDAVFLETSKKRLILRRKNGPVFGDDELEKFVGKKVECDGFIVGTTFLAEEIRIVE